MDQDNFTDTLPSDDQSHRRSFGGLGRGPAALLVTAGLLIGWHRRLCRRKCSFVGHDHGVHHPGDAASVPEHG